MGVDAGHGAEGVTHLLPGLKGTSGVSGEGGGERGVEAPYVYMVAE